MARFKIGQRLRFTGEQFYGDNGQSYATPSGCFADVTGHNGTFYSLRLYPTVDGKVVTVDGKVVAVDGKVVAVEAYGFDEARLKSVRGKPFIEGIDPRRREGTNPDGSGSPKVERVGNGDRCPVCKTGTMKVKQGRKGDFLGCSHFPSCKHTQSVTPDGDTSVPSDPVPSSQGDEDMASGSDISPEVLAIAKILANAGSKAPAGLQESDVVSIVDKLATQKGWGSAKVVVKIKDVETSFPGLKHQVLDKVLKKAARRANVFVVGPAGSGKTTLGEQVAMAIFGDAEKHFASLSCSPGMPESRWMGKLIQNITTGEEHYIPSKFVEIYEQGGVFLADEVDNSDASTLLVLNSALANGHITLPNGRRVQRHKDFIFIVSANTYGHGQSREYVGRSQLDAAFLDRFVGSTVEMGYDRALETALCPEAEIREAVWGIRDKVESLKLRRIVSTRSVLSARQIVLAEGEKLKDALREITVGWSEADCKAVGIK